jgi:hypothetical protein|tara:strand:- start:1569 stop:2051 length:483 start_codon:yes stop_codon:yes gene_type:complete
MTNCLPVHIKDWSEIYDLKGSADDKTMMEDGVKVPEVHKRCWNAGMIICEATGCNKGISLSRQRYTTGKQKAYKVPIYVTKEQKEEILTTLKDDLAFLVQFGLMDYSMIVGVYRPVPGDSVENLVRKKSLVDSKAYVSQHTGDLTIVYFGIIDFLQVRSA